MTWQKNATNHVPEWLNVRMIGLRETAEHFGEFIVAGFVAGVVAGLLIGWVKNDDWNGQEIAAKKWQAGVEKSNQLHAQMCKQFPNSGACKK